MANKSLEELEAAMRQRKPHYCMRVSEEEMRTVIAAGGKVVSVKDDGTPGLQRYYSEIELGRGHYFAYSRSDPRQPE